MDWLSVGGRGFTQKKNGLGLTIIVFTAVDKSVPSKVV